MKAAVACKGVQRQVEQMTLCKCTGEAFVLHGGAALVYVVVTAATLLTKSCNLPMQLQDVTLPGV
jgi:hypothetical protein